MTQSNRNQFSNSATTDWKPLIARHWSQRSDGYNRWVLRSLRTPGYRKPFEAIFSRVFGPPPLHIVDVGTGPGVVSFLLKGLGHKLTAVDLSEGMLEQARLNSKTLHYDVEFQQADAENLPFADASFDGLASRLVLWNLTNPERALREWVRVLRPGGKLVILDCDMGKLRPGWWWRKLWQIASAPIVILTEQRNPLEKRMKRKDVNRLPMSQVKRPDWEMEQLRKLGLSELRKETVGRAQLGLLDYLKYGYWGGYVGVSGVKR